jgi:membrane associated rhomboid family serine protease
LDTAVFPLGTDRPSERAPVLTVLLLAALVLTWVGLQGAGLDAHALAASTCNLGLVPGEVTQRAEIGTAIPLGHGLACVVDREPINALTPLTSMFLHGSWGHLAGNALFLWTFGRGIEDSVGHLRFVLFYLLCGLAAALAQILVHPASPVPMVGASGAISGVLGGYLLLHPRVPVRVLFVWVIFVQIIRIPAFLLLLWWIGYQLILGLPELSRLPGEPSTGVAFWAHIGGFAAGLATVRLFVREPTEGRAPRRDPAPRQSS